MYFLAIEITRRRLASVISRLARRALASPVDICLLMSFRSLSGMTTRFCRSSSFCCCSRIAGEARQRLAVRLCLGDLAVDPAQVESSLPGNILMKCGRGMPPLLTHRSWILRSCGRTFVHLRAHAVAQALDLRAVKRIFISSAEICSCSLRYFCARWPCFCRACEHVRVQAADRGEALQRVRP